MTQTLGKIRLRESISEKEEVWFTTDEVLGKKKEKFSCKKLNSKKEN